MFIADKYTIRFTFDVLEIPIYNSDNLSFDNRIVLSSG